jgi:hypothetical protein
MNVDYSVKRGDTAPPIAAQLTMRDTAAPDARARVAIDLSAATAVRFLMKSFNGKRAFAGTCDITDAPLGQVSWVIDPDFTASPDIYQAEYEITWNDGTIQTVPDDGYAVVEVEQDLG